MERLHQGVVVHLSQEAPESAMSVTKSFTFSLEELFLIVLKLTFFRRGV